MSNLFKQYNTAGTQGVRVIDYNPMVEEKLAEFVRQQKGGSRAVDQGFRSLGDVVEEVAPEDPAEILQKAKDEAEMLLRKAREESESALTKAKEQAQQIMSQAKKDGHQEGYEQGFAQMKGELEEEYEKRREELEQFKLKLQEDYNREMHDLEPKLLDVIVSVVEKVFHIQFGDKKEILLYLIGNTIANIEGCKAFRIRIAEEQKVFLDTHKEEILDRIGHDMSIELVPDVSLDGTQCVIETDTGVFDCSLGVQLENLIKDLRALSL